MRRLLDGLYDGAAALAALCMVGLLGMVLLSIVSRQLHFHVPGTDAYAGYLMAAADAEARGWAASKKVNTDTLDKLRANGMQVLPPPPLLKADLAKVGDTMLKEWADKAGAEGQQLISALRK